MSGIRVVGIDIDGVIGDYSSHWHRFAELWSGEALKHPNERRHGQATRELWDWRHEKYNRCKKAYRTSGVKRSMPLLDGSHELLRKINLSGVQILLCTARPKLPEVEVATAEWLEMRGLGMVTNVIYHPNKFNCLSGRFAGDIVCVIDDDPLHITQATACGLRSILFAQPYNEGFIAPAESKVARTHAEIWEHYQELYFDHYRDEQRRTGATG